MTVNLRTGSESQELAILGKDNPELINLIQIYPPEMHCLLLNNKEKLNRLSKLLNGVSKNACINTMIMKCTQQCIYKDICILAKEGLAPTDYPCPIEKKLIMDLEFDIVKSLEIDQNNPIEMEMLWDLIDTKLLDMRGSASLKDGKLTQTIEQKIGPATFTREEISPTIEAKLELKKLKHSIIDSFVATRRAKKKYGMDSNSRSIEQMIKEAAENVNE
jgi:hypothetical protein